MWRVLIFFQWSISTVLLIVTRLRQSRVSTACFSVVTEYIKTIALFLLGAGLLLRGFSVSYWAALLRLRQWRHSFPSCCYIHSLALGSCLPLPHTSQIHRYTSIFFLSFNYFSFYFGSHVFSSLALACMFNVIRLREGLRPPAVYPAVRHG